MSQTNNAVVNELFKKVYGETKDLQPADYPLAKMIPWKDNQMVGDEFIEHAVLTSECGWTLAGETAEAFDINPAIAGTTKQIKVKPSQSVLPSILPWGMISRSTGSEKAFLQSTKHLVKNNLKSHGKLLEIMRIHGQATKLLGYVAYNTSTYRGVSMTAGAGTLNGIVFATGGTSAGSKAILFKPGDFAAGIWVGMEGCIVQEVDANNLVVAEGKLTGVDAEFGFIYVDFTPVTASSATSHRICFKGMAESKEMLGILGILGKTTGTLFGVNVANYSLWKPIQVACGAAKFSFDLLSNGVAMAVNRGGLGDGALGGGDLDVIVNPRTWARLIQTEAGRKSNDSSYSPAQAENGMRSIQFHTEAGICNIKSHRMVPEGSAIGLHLEDWSRSGSAQVSLKVPGMGEDLVKELERQAGYAYRSFADEYTFCNAPARSILWTGINDEAT